MSSKDTPTEQAEESVTSTQQAAHTGSDGDRDDAAETKKSSGVVKWFSVSKGFGFIQPDEGDGEVFVHQTSIVADGFRSLREGEAVEYDLEVAGDGRAKALNVTGPEGAPPEGAPRRMTPSAQPFTIMPAQQQYAMYNPYAAYPPVFRGGMGGRFPRPSFSAAGRGPYGFGRGGFPVMERPPPPGTPGISSGFQVVVHNLPWSITWQELKDIFSSTPGVVRADVIIDSSGRSRGFGTVRYKTQAEAQQAAEMMNNIEIGNRLVSVRIDRFA